MSDNITKRVGLGTAYGFAKAGGYEGTVAEFTELLGNIAIDLARIENLSVTVTTLPAGSQATASLNGSVLSLGIPKGDKGDKGNTGETGAPAGFGTVSATVDDTIGTPSVEVTASGADTAKNFAFAFHNLKGQKGDKGDTGEVSEAELTQAFEDFSANGTVANAEQLTTDIRANDQTPYLFRTAGGSVDIGDREYINGIVGGTVVWNQLMSVSGIDSTVTVKGVTFTNNNDGSVTINGTATDGINGNDFRAISSHSPISGHKYLLSGCPSGGSRTTYFVYDGYAVRDLGDGTVAIPQLLRCVFYAASGTVFNNAKFVPQIFDLTQMFGTTIADYIYSLEQANAGAGVAWFRKLFPKPYYAYNAGELMSVQASSHDMVGFNAWDEEWESGAISASTGNTSANANYSRSKNFCKILPNTTYYRGSASITNFGMFFYDADKNYIGVNYYSTPQVFTTPSNASYFKVHWEGTTYGNNICINLSWDGERDGEYEAYVKHSYALDSSLTLRGIPKLDASNNLYYDGDTYESDGTVTRRYGIVDLGTLTWDTDASEEWGRRFYSTGINTLAKATATNAIVGNIMCDKYTTIAAQYIFIADTDKVVAVSNTGAVSVKDSNYTATATFKTAMSGVYLVYELATPTTEEADPYTNPQIVNDFGTEEFVISNTVAVPIPVGHNTDYPINLKAKVEMAPNSPDGDGDYIVRQTNGTNEYVSIANNATIQNILARLEALEG